MLRGKTLDGGVYIGRQTKRDPDRVRVELRLRHNDTTIAHKGAKWSGKMAWAKIDDRFFSHPKVRRAGKDAVLLYLAGLTYCNEHLTDGFIPEDSLPLLGLMGFVDDVKQSSSKLLDVGLWDVSSNGLTNGYEVHDYFDHNPTREQVEATKAARAEAGSRGGKASVASKSQAKAQAKPKQTSSNIPSPPDIKTTTTAAMTPAQEWIATGTQKLERVCGMFIVSANISADVADILEELYNRQLTSWLDDALNYAAARGARNWAYVKATLQGCLKDGTPPGTKPPKAETARRNNGSKSSIQRNGTGNGKAEPKAWAGDYDQLRQEWAEAEQHGDK